MKKIQDIILQIYFILLPIDSALGNIIGKMSLVNYFIVTYIILSLINMKKIKIKKEIFLTFIFFISFSYVSLFWGVRDIKDILFRETEIYTLSLSVIFYITISIQENNFNKILKYISRGSIVVILCTLYSKYIGNSIDYGSRTVLIIGRYFDPNYYIVGLNLLFLLNIEMVLKHKAKINIIYIIIYTYIIFICGSRTGMITIFLSTIFYIIMKNKNKKRILLYMIVIFLIILILIPNVKYMINSNLLKRYTLQNIIESKGSNRLDYWISAYKYLVNDNSIFRYFNGYGLFSFPIAPNKYLNVLGAPHNLYIQILFETGIIGICSFFIFMLINIKNCKKNILLTSAILGILISGLGLDSIRTRYFWTVLSLVNIYINSKKRRKN